MNRILSARLVCAAAAAATVAITAVPAQASGPANARIIVGGPASAEYDMLSPIIGSSNYLVYEDQPVVAGGMPNVIQPRTYARNANGHTIRLAIPTDPDGANRERLHSVVGDWLVGRRVGTRTADWWNAATGHHGTLQLPPHVDLLTALPTGGLTYISRDGRLHAETFSGHVSVLGRPFDSEPRDYYNQGELGVTEFVSADSHGIVLGGGDDSSANNPAGAVRYISFAHPGVVHRLTDPIGDAQLCGAVDSTYAACIAVAPEIDWSGDDPETSGVALIPLDGSTPTTETGVGAEIGYTGAVGLHGSRIVWADFHGYPDTTIYSMGAGASAASTGTALVHIGATAAYDGLAAATASQSRIVLATSANDVTPTIGATRSPITATGFALTAGRLVDVDDAPDTQNAPATVRSRSLGITGGRVSVGASTAIGRATASAPFFAAGNGQVPDALAASSDATAYTVVTDGGEATTHVVTAHGETTLPTAPNAPIALSGNRLLYLSNPFTTRETFTVRNLSNGSDQALPGGKVAGAIFGHFVVQLDKYGRVTRRDLDSGKVTQLTAHGPLGLYHWQPQAFAYGDFAAWTYHGHTWIRNAKTMSHLVEVSGTAVGIGKQGVLLASSAYGSPSGPVNLYNRATAIRLRHWSGATTLILSARRFGATPQISGNVLAWVDGSWRLQAAPLT